MLSLILVLAVQFSNIGQLCLSKKTFVIGCDTCHRQHRPGVNDIILVYLAIAACLHWRVMGWYKGTDMLGAIV